MGDARRHPEYVHIPLRKVAEQVAGAPRNGGQVAGVEAYPDGRGAVLDEGEGDGDKIGDAGAEGVVGVYEGEEVVGEGCGVGDEGGDFAVVGAGGV